MFLQLYEIILHDSSTDKIKISMAPMEIVSFCLENQNCDIAYYDSNFLFELHAM